MAVCSIDGCGKEMDSKNLCAIHYRRFLKYGNALHPLADFSVRARKAETAIAKILANFYKRQVIRMPYKAPYDLLVDGWRVDVKSAKMQMRRKQPYWFFGIHHRVIKPDKADFYILRMEDVPFTTKAIYLLIKAPVSVHHIEVTYHSLWSLYPYAAADFHRFAKGEFGRQAVAV